MVLPKQASWQYLGCVKGSFAKGLYQSSEMDLLMRDVIDTCSLVSENELANYTRIPTLHIADYLKP